MDFETADMMMMGAERRAVPKPSPWFYMLGDVLVKKRKPCLEGDYVHIHRWKGCYKVQNADMYGFNVMRNRKCIRLDWDQFRCLKGFGDHKMGMSEKEALIRLLALMQASSIKGKRQ